MQAWDFGAGPYKVGFPGSRRSPFNRPKPGGSSRSRDPKPPEFRQRLGEVFRILSIPQHRAERSESGRRAQKAGIKSTHQAIAEMGREIEQDVDPFSTATGDFTL